MVYVLPLQIVGVLLQFYFQSDQESVKTLRSCVYEEPVRRAIRAHGGAYPEVCPDLRNGDRDPADYLYDQYDLDGIGLVALEDA